MSMAAYFTLPVCVLVLLSIFIKPLRNPSIYTGYTAIVVFFVLLLLFADAGLYKEWGIRADDSFLKYLTNPREAWASISHLPVFAIILLFVVFFAILVYLSNRGIREMAPSLEKEVSKPVSALLVLLVTVALVIPLRGGFQLAPINQSSVYFSLNHFSNLAAVNPVWNFAHAIQHPGGSGKNPFVVLPDAVATTIVDSLYQQNKNAPPLFATKPNVIIIAWESFTSKAVELTKNGVVVTPGFNALRKEGIYFPNIYATGDRTDKGIVGILSGYPAQPTTSIVKVPTKAAGLPMLGKEFKNAGYQTAFYYGGELEFANMKAYLLSGGFDRFTSVDDFAKDQQNSKWGAHDGVVADKLTRDLSGITGPFFYTWLTLSSHEPFETPASIAIAGNDATDKFLNSLHYTDQVVTGFVNYCKSQPWWQNTLIFIVADHGHPLPEAANKAMNFHIPLLILGRGVRPQTIDKIGSQTDLAATLLGTMGMNYSQFNWSKNLLDSSSRSWGYFAFNNGFGFVNNQGKYIFDNVGKMPINFSGIDSGSLKQAGQAILQQSFADYLKR
jgi:phosphoglycerol transferase MdoB-like AlkP superfamily enzyme